MSINLDYKREELLRNSIFNKDICEYFYSSSGTTIEQRENRSACLDIHKQSRITYIILIIGILVAIGFIGTSIYQLTSPLYEFTNAWSYLLVVGMILLAGSSLFYIFRMIKIQPKRREIANKLK